MPPVRSHPVVHPDPAPVEAPPPAPAPAAADPAPAPAQGQGQGENAPPGVLMTAHPRVALGFRLAQAFLAAAAVAAMASAHDFTSFTAFRYLVSAGALQCMWSLAMAIVLVYALLLGRSFRNLRARCIFCIGDWITGALTFNAACASAGITTLIANDLEIGFENHRPRFMAATAMAFLSWFLVALFCLGNLGTVVHKLQRP